MVHPARRPVVSIVTVSFNSAATIRDTIESVLAQDYGSIQYLVIDGGSTDGTLDVLARYRDRIDVLVSEPDRGIYDAMNKGIRLATGELVGLLNSDDCYADSRAISDLVATLNAAGTDSVFADLVYVDAANLQEVRRYFDSSRWSPQRFRFGLMPAHPTFFIRREWYERCGLHSLDYRIASDFEMLVRLLYRGRATYAHLARPIVRMRIGGASTRGLRSSWLLNREMVRACRAHGIWTGLPLFLLKVPMKLLETVGARRRAAGAGLPLASSDRP